jgi:type II secretory ATPase GspE/PulE/Tfp pilus assembly ATPase PilB-like protein
MEPAEMPQELWREIGGREGEPMRAVIGRGCEECAQTGYRGRQGIYELLMVSDQVRQLILKRSSSDIIRDAAVKLGMRTLREDGWRTVRAGTTTVAEVVRVTQEEV